MLKKFIRKERLKSINMIEIMSKKRIVRKYISIILCTLLIISGAQFVFGDNPLIKQPYHEEILDDYTQSRYQIITIKFKDGNDNYFKIDSSKSKMFPNF